MVPLVSSLVIVMRREQKCQICEPDWDDLVVVCEDVEDQQTAPSPTCSASGFHRQFAPFDH